MITHTDFTHSCISTYSTNFSYYGRKEHYRNESINEEYEASKTARHLAERYTDEETLQVIAVSSTITPMFNSMIGDVRS